MLSQMFDPAPITLRPYQVDCISAVQGARERGVQRLIAVLATGLGKTTIAAELIRRELEDGGRALFMAHREELIDQGAERFRQMVPGAQVGIEGGDQWAGSWCDVVVASVPTIGLERSRRLEHFNPTLVILDECHHAPSSTNERAARRFGCFDDNGAFYLGLTATAHRMDNKPLHGTEDAIFQEVAYNYPIKPAILDGWLCDIKAYRALAGYSLSDVKKSGGDFNQAELQRVVNTPEQNMAAFEHWRSVASDRPTICFTTGVEHAHAMSQLFSAAGYSSAAIDGTTPKDERARIINACKRGEIQVLCNYGICTEGFDWPEAACVLMIRPTQSWSLFVQCIGRGVRLAPGKENCIAEGELILTDHGLIPIQLVTTDMKVWDGVEFVTHCGTICRGVQTVIEYAGLVATPDHQVWTQQGWKSFGECACKQIAIAVTGVGGRAVREVDSHFRRDNPEGQIQPTLPISRMRMRATIREGIRSCGAPKERMPRLRSAATSAAVASEQSHRSKTALHESKCNCLRALRRAWDRVQVLWSNRYGCLGNGESRVAQRPTVGSHRQQWALRTRQPAIFNCFPQSKQHTSAAIESRDACFPHRLSRSRLRGCDPHPVDRFGIELEGDCGTIPETISQTERPVWDILNAGPRHRFTASGLLVSNCIVIDIVGDGAGDKVASVPGALGLPSGMRQNGGSMRQMMERLDELPGWMQARLSTREFDASDLDAVLREVNLLAELDPPVEIAVCSTFAWLKLSADAYVISCGSCRERGFRREAMITCDMLGQWHVHLFEGGSATEHKVRVVHQHVGDNLQTAVANAETVMRGRWPSVGAVADSNAPWRRRTVKSEKQVLWCKKFGLSDTEINEMNAGQVSAFLDREFSKRRRR